ncbi:MAG: hypothetical protein ABFS38_21140 [Bacteroidota bacterium]
MTRQESLKFCRKCTHRELDFKQGLLCDLTHKVADFDGECEHFKLDETKKDQVKEVPKKHDHIPEEPVNIEITEEDLEKLKEHQDFYYAVIGGILATVISAVIWAVITVSTESQIGFMAVGVGLLVGLTVRFFGAGIDKKFGYLGALLSLLGCMLGNLFSQVGFITQEESLGYFETLTYLNFGLIIDLLVYSFHPMDLLFYGIAIYEGYRLAFRRINVALLSKLESGEYNGVPGFNRIRMPLIIVSILALSFIAFTVKQGVNGLITHHYESGQKMSEGEMKQSREIGEWTYWYDNGNKQCVGFYNAGIQDSLWYWYDEDGKLTGTGMYNNGLENGVWINYYSEGMHSDSGAYIDGRRSGLWKYWHENGNLAYAGEIKRGEQIGCWTKYHNNGKKAEEVSHLHSDTMLIENVWDREGNQLVVNRNGSYVGYWEDGKVSASGEIKGGLRIGTWKSYYENGTLREEGGYNNNIYLVSNSWDPDGKEEVKEGNGIYYSYFSGTHDVFESGEIGAGFREGVWNTFYAESGSLLAESTYEKGKQSGPYRVYYESGQLQVSGEIMDGSREGEWNWYHENGNLSSSVTFEADRKTGKQTMWSTSGEVLKEEYYQNGELVMQ